MEPTPFARRIGSRKLAGELCVVARRGFEEELADRLQMRRQRIDRLGRPRVAAQRAVGGQHGLRRLLGDEESGDGFGRRFARPLQAIAHRTQPLGPIGGA